MTTLKGSTDIRLLVNNEQDLYTPLSPESEFRQEVKDYIRKKAACADYNNNFRLRVICSSPVDEQKFRADVASWAREEKISFSQESKATNRLLIGMLVIASVFIILSLYLAKYLSVLSYTIVPVLGSVALGRAAGIFLSDLPINTAKQRLIDEWEKKSIIVFEYPDPE